MILVQPQSLWLNSGCPTQKSLDTTASSKSRAKGLKLKKSKCYWVFCKKEEAILSAIEIFGTGENVSASTASVARNRASGARDPPDMGDGGRLGLTAPSRTVNY
jgi:hypothetical protein